MISVDLILERVVGFLDALVGPFVGLELLGYRLQILGNRGFGVGQEVDFLVDVADSVKRERAASVVRNGVK